jgi:hypothetical protein
MRSCLVVPSGVYVASSTCSRFLARANTTINVAEQAAGSARGSF